MPSSPEGWVVAGIGALIVIAEAMVAGRRLELLAARHAPRLIPKDLGAAAGMVVGLAIVAGWIIYR